MGLGHANIRNWTEQNRKSFVYLVYSSFYVTETLWPSSGFIHALTKHPSESIFFQGFQIVRFITKSAVLEALMRAGLRCDSHPLVVRFWGLKKCENAIFVQKVAIVAIFRSFGPFFDKSALLTTWVTWKLWFLNPLYIVVHLKKI